MRAARLLGLIVAACGASPSSPSSPSSPPDAPSVGLVWLVGTWESVKGDSVNVQTWTFKGGTLVGRTVASKGGERVSEETVRIEYVGGVLTYRTSPRGREPHDFRMVTRAGQSVTFEDPGYDWPQRIRYVRDSDRLQAVVSGRAQNSRSFSRTWRRISKTDVTVAVMPDDLLGAVGRALRARDWDAATGLIELHTRDFPSEAQGDRDRLRIVALCGQGNEPEAAKLAQEVASRRVAACAAHREGCDPSRPTPPFETLVELGLAKCAMAVAAAGDAVDPPDEGVAAQRIGLLCASEYAELAAAWGGSCAAP